LLKKINKAVRDHDLIEERDRIAVAVSGGKDSLSLLKLLNTRRRAVKESHELVAIHVRLHLNCDGYVPRSELEGLFQIEGVEYCLEEVTILGENGHMLSNWIAFGAPRIAGKRSSWLRTV
jgi:hypothetical protein